MSEQPDQDLDQQGESLSEEGAGLGLDEEANTFEPEEDPESTQEPEEPVGA